MTRSLVSACAAALIGLAASSAGAGDFTIADDVLSGGIIAAGDSRYSQNGRYDAWPNRAPGYGYGYGNDWNRDRGWGNGWGQGGYGDHRVVSPRHIVWKLSRHRFTRITEPMLAGRYYQVKARDPRGRNVKLYIDAYSGEIARWKFRG